MGLGPESRIDMLRNILTGLVRDETTETTRARADEDRFYDEKLTDYAKRGDTNEKSMKMADFWLTLISGYFSETMVNFRKGWITLKGNPKLNEKNLIPKRFKVLALRFENQTSGYTRMAHIPNRDNLDRAPMAVLEYKGNTFPPLFPVKRVSELNLLNQLLTGYREENAQMVAESKDI